ncbi:MAG: Rieske (2Fe-2S) protein [Bacillota bacterium]
MAWVSLCQLDGLKEGLGKYVEVDGFQLAVFLDHGQPYVIDNYCPHAGGSLSGGDVQAGHAVCPWHQWSFSLQTGQLRNRPLVKIRTYTTRLLEREGKPTLLQADLPTY